MENGAKSWPNGGIFWRNLTRLCGFYAEIIVEIFWTTVGMRGYSQMVSYAFPQFSHHSHPAPRSTQGPYSGVFVYTLDSHYNLNQLQRGICIVCIYAVLTALTQIATAGYYGKVYSCVVFLYSVY